MELLGPLGCGIQTGAGAVLKALNVRFEFCRLRRRRGRSQRGHGGAGSGPVVLVVGCGFSFDRPRLAAERPWHEKTTKTDRYRNQKREGQGGTGALAQNINPFDAVWPVLCR